MGLETALIAAAVIGAGASVGTALSQKSPKTPKPQKQVDGEAAAKIASSAQEAQRKQALAAYSRSDTVLTGKGQQGDNGLGGANMLGTRKSLLGQ